MAENTKEFDAVKKFLDADIVETFEEIVDDKWDGPRPRNFWVANSALVATNLQLIRVLREAFSRGFIVQK